MSKGVLVRKVTEDDIEEIASIETEVQIQPWSKKSLLQSIKGRGKIKSWCAVDAQHGKIKGYIFFRIVADEAYILNLSIAQNEQGKGIGTLLLAMLKRYAELNGAHRIVLDVHRKNTRAKTFYRKRGFISTKPQCSPGASHITMVLPIKHPYPDTL